MTSTADGLSQEEFLRLQEQLIELRNTNYELKEKLKKATLSENEPSSAKKDALQFASRLLNRSQEKECQQRLEAEVDSLRQKLQQQEEEFRLQQQTFITELNKVVRQSESLQKELNSSRNGENPLLDYQSQIEELNLKLKHSIEESSKLREELEDSRKKSEQLKEKLEDQTNLVNVFENTVLDLRQQIDRLKKKHENEISARDSQLQEASQAIEDLNLALERAKDLIEENNGEIKKKNETISLLDDEKTCLKNEISSQKTELTKYKEDKAKLAKMYSDLEREVEERKKEAEEVRQSHNFEINRLQKEADARMSEMQENFKLKMNEALASLQEELEKKNSLHSAGIETLKSEFKLDKESWEAEIEKRELAHDLEMNKMRSEFDGEKKNLEEKISQLVAELAVKDNEKNLALKKQNHLIKELQKAVNEERKRADSVEKLKERDWHVVDSDARSSNTYDGNESVSSLSALESDNVELINKLTQLQKSHSDVVDKLKTAEFENEALHKEILEKGEVIEHWIRSRPMTSTQGNTAQKNENPLRKFLATTLAGDEQVTDLRDMNRKLQRMLEETLSKNIILQRDLQTLIERTEM